MKIELAIGKETQVVDIPNSNLIDILKQNDIKFQRKGVDSINFSLDHPIGTPKLENIIKPNKKIVIITSDITRPVPSDIILPVILERLLLAGAREQDISIIFALGSHRNHSKEEMMKLVGEDIYQRYECLDMNPNELIRLGFTKAGTPVDIYQKVIEANYRICIGNIEYHYFAGYSGGAKAIMPGVSSRDAIQKNHSNMIAPNARTGNLIDNPVRDDIEEAVRDFCPIDFICNVILDEHKQIIYTVSGDFIKAHREGCKFLDTLYLKKINEKADIVVVSQGGYPKDINVYQTQKALDNARHAVKDEGIIILVGSCEEGYGEKVFEQWIKEAKKPEDLINRIKREFRLGGHKAAAIALVLEKAEVYLVSNLADQDVMQMFMKPYKNIQSALKNALKKKGKNARILVMPVGGSTLPELVEK